MFIRAQVAQSLPQLSRAFHIGAVQPALSHAGLSAAPPNADPYVSTLSGELALRLSYPYSCARTPRSTARLSACDARGNEVDVSEFVLQQTRPNERAVRHSIYEL